MYPKPEDKTRNISDGVEVNEDGEIIAYHLLILEYANFIRHLY